MGKNIYFKISTFSIILSLSILLLLSLFSHGNPLALKSTRQNKVLGDPGNIRINPYLFKGYSSKKICSSQANSLYNYGLLHTASDNIVDTLKIYAIRVEFKIDSSENTTGNGLFGIYRTNKGARDDLIEWGYYAQNNGDAYKYDNLPHDSSYFAYHLEFVKKYFWKVSNKHLYIDYVIYPNGKREEDAYKVPEKMTKYSPGAKKKKESWDEYYYRRTIGIMKFVRDAIHAADSSDNSPFKNLEMDSTDGILYEFDPEEPAIRKKAAILIFHAGASYLTDGGWSGYFGQDSPSDMIDAFISTEFFSYFADSIEGIETDSNNVSGIRVNINMSNEFVLDELMMVSETSNQDSLNWGIHGILVNQVARQIGIPDLFSTMSGISGIGGFCIMDFAGYSCGRGFIPPWPSAWVRAYMGWDTPYITNPSTQKEAANLTALGAANPVDTTILLVPINSHEYYLIENRQRNLTGDISLFNYDTLESGDTIYIDPYDHVNLDKNVLSTFPGSNIIDSVENFDIGIPASGVLIWHIDEYIIRDHLEQNVINADSSYRGVSLEEADGINDLGVMFQDMFYQAAFDYGGAEDVFPHYTSKNNTPITMIGPFTRPSTQSNDGGHTYLKINVSKSGKSPPSGSAEEVSAIRDYFVYNFVDSIFHITVKLDTEFITNLPEWPKQIIPCKFFEPVVCDVFANGDTLELTVLDTTGRLYVWTSGNESGSFGNKKEATPSLLFSYDTLYTDTITYLETIPNPVSFPTCVNKSVYIPSKNGSIYILRNVSTSSTVWDTVVLNSPASSYICNYTGTKWAVGCKNGDVVFGSDESNNQTPLKTFSSAPIQAIAVINDIEGTLAAVDKEGLLTVCSSTENLDSVSVEIGKNESFYPPFTLATADLDQDGIIDIVVCDNKQGLWLFNYDESAKSLVSDPDWGNRPNDWAGSHRVDTSRSAIPDNPSAPSIADLDNDNMLDIITGGTNGIYVCNHRGVQLANFPALLDTRFWYQRGSIISTPVVAFESDKKSPLVIFSAPTGENVTFAIANIDSTNLKTGTIYYTRSDGVTDSVSGLTASLIDSLLVMGDSLILPYILPGGYIDAFNSVGKRPTTINTLANVGKEIQSNWPFSVGGSISTSPIICDMENNNKTDILAVSDGGWVYRWEVPENILSNSFIWPVAGATMSRTFSYSCSIDSLSYTSKSEIEHFYNYPNPTKGAKGTTFKYHLSKPASRVNLDIFTYTGYHILSKNDLPSGFGWNEYSILLKNMGSAVYRCRLEVNFNGTKRVKYWKMAVIN